MIPGMLSPGSIAALSLGLPRVAPGVGQPLPRVRAVAGQITQPNSSALPNVMPPAMRDAPVAPSRTLPRGSLLDLSV
jgi:hypothetical protein